MDVVVNGIKRAFEVLRGQRKHEPQDIVSKDYGGDTIATNDKQDVAEDGAEVLSYDMELMFNDALSNTEGKILVM